MIILIILITFITLSLYGLKESRITKINKSIKGPKLLPVVGNLFDLKKDGRDIHETINYFYKLYGPIYRMKFGSIETVVLTDHLLREAFVDNGDKFMNRYIRKSRAKNTKCLSIGNSNNQYYKQLASIISPEFTMSNIKKNLEPHIKSELIAFCKFIDDKDGEEIHLNYYVRYFTLNCILMTMFGKRYSYDGGNEEECMKINELIKSCSRYVTNSGRVVLGDFIPALHFILKDKPVEYYASYRELIEYVNRFVEQSNNEMINDQPTNVSQVLYLQYKQGLIEYEAIAANCVDLVLRRIKKKKNTICFTITAVLNNQLQSKLFNSIHINIQSDIQTILYSDYKLKLQYLQNVIKESFRMYPPAPLSIQHECIKDCEIGGFKIAAGTQIFQNIYGSHLSEESWDNPLSFNPDRFNNNGNNNNSQKIYQYGIGLRRCIGFNLSDSEIFSFLATVFNRYEFIIPVSQQNSKLDDKGIFSLALQCPKISIILKKR